MYRFSLRIISFLFKNNININKGACLIKQKLPNKVFNVKLKLFKNLPHFNFAITGTTQ